MPERESSRWYGPYVIYFAERKCLSILQEKDPSSLQIKRGRRICLFLLRRHFVDCFLIAAIISPPHHCFPVSVCRKQCSNPSGSAGLSARMVMMVSKLSELLIISKGSLCLQFVCFQQEEEHCHPTNAHSSATKLLGRSVESPPKLSAFAEKSHALMGLIQFFTPESSLTLPLTSSL